MFSEFNPSNLKFEFKDFIGIFENAFTKNECDRTVKLFEVFHQNGYTRERLQPYYKDDYGMEVSPTDHRVLTNELDWNTEFIAPFNDRLYNYLYAIYNNQYPILHILTKHQSKFIKIQKTHPTQGYHQWHCEYEGHFEADRRILSWILYLNDVEEGGETEFLYQSLRIKPKKGTFIMFPGCFTHTHRGNPPISGVKYIATGWMEFAYTDERQGRSKPPDLSPPNNPQGMIRY